MNNLSFLKNWGLIGKNDQDISIHNRIYNKPTTVALNIATDRGRLKSAALWKPLALGSTDSSWIESEA